MDPQETKPDQPRSRWSRILVAGVVVLAFSLGVYLLLESVRPHPGLISFSFLMILPAAICAAFAYMLDDTGSRSLLTYLMIPIWILAGVVVVAFLALREGVICILLLSPLWLVSGLIGVSITYYLRRRLKRGRTYCSVLAVAPLLAIQLEPAFPPPAVSAAVTRTVIIDAPPERIWPLVQGIPDVRPDEGRWNFTQDVLGVPRPLGARLVGQGVGAQRQASWSDRIRFREEIVEWRPARRIDWRFIFDDDHGWDLTDRHLKPDSAYFRVVSGGYTLTPLGPNRTRVSLETRYWIKTPVNAYSRLWGEVFLGDIHDNLLAIVKRRAEGA